RDRRWARGGRSWHARGHATWRRGAANIGTRYGPRVVAVHERGTEVDSARNGFAPAVEPARVTHPQGSVLDVAVAVEPLAGERIRDDWIGREKSTQRGIVKATAHVDEPELELPMPGEADHHSLAGDALVAEGLEERPGHHGPGAVGQEIGRAVRVGMNVDG